MQFSLSRMFAVVLAYLVAQAKAYPMQSWPLYPQQAREYADDDYYYAPKVNYFYDSPSPAVHSPVVYGQMPAYPYYYDSWTDDQPPKGHEERLAALPVGQETWFESESTPRWRGDDDDVSAAFLDNLILTQMAQDAQRRRENTRAAFPPSDFEERDAEDEDVRELKALAGKPLYHVPKTVPRIEEDDYPADEGFINWNGNKRSVTTVAPVGTARPKVGQKEIDTGTVQNSAPKNRWDKQNKRNSEFYQQLKQLLTNKSKSMQQQEAAPRRIEKRFVAGDNDLVLELRGLKHRIPT